MMMKLFDFWAEWCAPCKAMMPIVEQVVGERFKDKIELVKINIEEHPEIADLFGIRAVPTLVLVNEDGIEKMRLVGAKSAKSLELDLQAATS